MSPLAHYTSTGVTQCNAVRGKVPISGSRATRKSVSEIRRYHSLTSDDSIGNDFLHRIGVDVHPFVRVLFNRLHVPFVRFLGCVDQHDATCKP